MAQPIHNLDRDGPEAIRKFGETGELTEDALYAIGSMIAGWKEQTDEIRPENFELFFMGLDPYE